MSHSSTPRRGEVWWFDPSGARGTELNRKVRPALVVSVDAIDLHRLGKLVVVPGSSRPHPSPLHVPFRHRLRGQPATTYFCCEDVRSIDASLRLRGRMGGRVVPPAVVAEVERVLRLLLGL
jgi:mRNA interferase MazF